MVGDFNCHVDDLADHEAARFQDMISTYGLTQRVTSATHVKGHILDLVLTRSSEPAVEDISVQSSALPEICDHFPVLFSLPVTKPKPQEKVITYRKYSQISTDTFREDLKESLESLSGDPDLSTSQLVDKYNSVLVELLDKYAPGKERRVTSRPQPAWYTDDILAAKRTCRKAERKWQDTGLVVHQEITKDRRREMSRLIDQAKKEYFNGRIADAQSEGDSKGLFKTLDQLLHRRTPSILPSHDTRDGLTERFAEFFTHKITKIRSDLAAVREHYPNMPEDSNIHQINSTFSLSNFPPATEAEIRKLVTQSPSKSCGLDPIPTWLLKENLDTLLPLLTQIVNSSLSAGDVPDSMKEAIVTPLLKKSNLDPELLKNFRPVSNLSFVSKLVERVVADRLTSHMQENGLHETLQSAYKKHHSTETALLKISDSVLHAMDEKKMYPAGAAGSICGF